MTGMVRISIPSAMVLVAALLGACSSAPTRAPSDAATAARAADQALRMQGKPYRHGGNSPQGFDCSGLVHYSFSRVGVRLARSTDGLWQQSRPITVSKLERGDLLFFDQEGKRSSHVAIYVGNNRFVHAPSSGKTVNVASLSDPYWRKHFAGARRAQWD